MSVQKQNANVFANFKEKLANISNVPKWLKVVQKFRTWTCDVKAYYPEAKPEIIDCVQIATNAVLGTLPIQLLQGPVAQLSFSEPYRPAFDELRRLLVTVGAYQFEFIDPCKNDTPEHSLLNKLRSHLVHVGINPDSLLQQDSLVVAMRTVILDEGAQQRIVKNVAKRRPDSSSLAPSSSPAVELMSSVPSSHTSSFTGFTTPATSIVQSTDIPKPSNTSLSLPHSPGQTPARHDTATAMTPTALPSPSPDLSNVTAPLPPPKAPLKKRKRKRDWIDQDLKEFEKGKKMDGSSEGITNSPLLPSVAIAATHTTAVEHAPSPALQPVLNVSDASLPVHIAAPSKPNGLVSTSVRPNKNGSQALLKALLASTKRQLGPQDAWEHIRTLQPLHGIDDRLTFRLKGLMDDAAQKLKDAKWGRAADGLDGSTSPAAVFKAGDVEKSNPTQSASISHVSFGEETVMVDLGFGRPQSTSFTLHVMFQPDQWRMVNAWKTAVDNNIDVSKALSVSLVCYLSEDIRAFRDSLTAVTYWDSTLARTLMPTSLHDKALSSLCLTINGRNIPSLTWMTSVTTDRFLDLSSYLVAGTNELTFVQSTDLSDFAFVLLVHQPIRQQLEGLETRHKSSKHIQSLLGRPIQAPQVDHRMAL